jgi:hypothetical protein
VGLNHVGTAVFVISGDDIVIDSFLIEVDLFRVGTVGWDAEPLHGRPLWVSTVAEGAHPDAQSVHQR